MAAMASKGKGAAAARAAPISPAQKPKSKSKSAEAAAAPAAAAANAKKKLVAAAAGSQQPELPLEQAAGAGEVQAAASSSDAKSNTKKRKNAVKVEQDLELPTTFPMDTALLVDWKPQTVKAKSSHTVFDVCLLVVNENEFWAAGQFLDLHSHFLIEGGYKAYAGVFKHKRETSVLFVQQPDAGTSGKVGSQQLMTALKPYTIGFVAAVGVAMGWDRTVQKRYDVLTATHVMPYAHVRHGEEIKLVKLSNGTQKVTKEKKTELREDVLPLDQNVSIQLKQHQRDWHFTHQIGADGKPCAELHKLKPHFGAMFSGDKLIADTDTRQALAELWNVDPLDPKLNGVPVIGAEMEGTGLFSMTERHVPVVLMKSATDFGFDKNEQNKDAPALAAAAAASVAADEAKKQAKRQKKNIMQRRGAFAAMTFFVGSLEHLTLTLPPMRSLAVTVNDTRPKDIVNLDRKQTVSEEVRQLFRDAATTHLAFCALKNQHTNAKADCEEQDDYKAQQKAVECLRDAINVAQDKFKVAEEALKRMVPHAAEMQAAAKKAVAAQVALANAWGTGNAVASVNVQISVKDRPEFLRLKSTLGDDGLTQGRIREVIGDKTLQRLLRQTRQPSSYSIVFPKLNENASLWASYLESELTKPPKKSRGKKGSAAAAAAAAVEPEEDFAAAEPQSDAGDDAADADADDGQPARKHRKPNPKDDS